MIADDRDIRERSYELADLVGIRAVTDGIAQEHVLIALLIAKPRQDDVERLEIAMHV